MSEHFPKLTIFAHMSQVTARDNSDEHLWQWTPSITGHDPWTLSQNTNYSTLITGAFFPVFFTFFALSNSNRLWNALAKLWKATLCGGWDMLEMGGKWRYLDNRCIFYPFSLLFLLNVIQLGYEMHMQSFVRLRYTAVELCLNWGKIKIHW